MSPLNGEGFDERAALAWRHREHERDLERWENRQGELNSSVTAGVDDRTEFD